jgi:hypothetical protein
MQAFNECMVDSGLSVKVQNKAPLLQPFNTPLELIVAARMVLPSFKSTLEAACHGLPGVNLIFKFPGKSLHRMIVKALLTGGDGTMISSSSSGSGERTGAEQGFFQSTQYANQLDLVTAVAKCSSFQAIDEVVQSIFDLHNEPSTGISIVKATNNMVAESRERCA